MPTILEVAAPQARILTSVPDAGPGVCDVCRGSPNPGFEICYSCEQAMGQVSRPCPTVVPFSLYRTQSQLWSVLRNYKDSPDPNVRARFSMQVAAFLGVALINHGDCIRGHCGDWDVITTVPSTSGKRIGPHPLVEALSRVEALRQQHVPLLAPGPVALDHNQAHDQGFVTTEPLTGRRVLLVDDTYTSGARVQSAASRLQLAGATVPAIVVVGRVISPEWSKPAAELWARQREVPFSFDTCALEPPHDEPFEEEDEDQWEEDWEPGEQYERDWSDWENGDDCEPF